MTGSGDELEAEMAKFRQAKAQSEALKRRAIPAMMDANGALFSELQKIFKRASLWTPSMRPYLADDDRTCITYFNVKPEMGATSEVTLWCRIRTDGERFRASWNVDGNGSNDFFDGPIAESQALKDACAAEANRAASAALRHLRIQMDP